MSHLEAYSAAFFMRNPIAGGLGPDELTIARTRMVGEGMQDTFVVRSHASRTLAFSLSSSSQTTSRTSSPVKQYDFALGDPMHADPLPPAGDARLDGDQEALVLTSSDGYLGRTHVFFSEPPH